MWRFLSFVSLTAFVCGKAELLEKREFTPVERREYLQTLMDAPDTSTVDKINAINELKHVGDVFEGDMRLTAKDRKYVDMREDGDVDGPLTEGNSRRSMQRDRSSLWRTRVIPYVIDQALVDAGFHTNILESIAEVKRISCVQWIKRTFQKHYVKFVKKDGCWSYVGNIRDEKGYQELSIGDGCETTDTILHEMFHAMGFYHEQSRPDRNKYIEILWENIQDGQKENFNKYKNKDVDYLSTQYDYDSIMHYGKLAFSKNGQPTIKVIGGKDRNFGDAKKLSEVDKMRLNALYECSKRGETWSSWTSFGPCDLDCYHTRQRFCFKRDLNLCSGADEYGIETETSRCSKCSGVIDGNWGRWSAFGTCTATCGRGTRTRTRLCDNPAPKGGGKACKGSATETSACVMNSCAIKKQNILGGCSFDNGMCEFRNDDYNSNQCTWKKEREGKGFYMAVNAARCFENDVARFNSPEFPQTSGSCLSFLYRITADKAGMLSVILNEEAYGETEIWSNSGGHHTQFQEAKVNFETAGEFSILFDAMIELPRGSIQIDQVVITKGSCST